MKAVIFDMDGVIIDSHKAASQLLCESANALGCGLTIQQIQTWGSLSSRQFWAKVKEQFHLRQSVAELIGMYDVEREIAMYTEIGLIPGVRELLMDLSKHGLPAALATSASRRRMNAVLEMFELHALFRHCVCDEDAAQSKPHPDIYLTASRRLGVEPEECIVFEDSFNGMTAAKRAGMSCVGYRGLDHVQEDLSECDWIIYDFREIDTAALVGRFKSG
ncbi:HAD family hydrolase [Paenibacillus piri]|uniref:HAD family phosphatase n=1 Tax=Paenibacillus piri TaxID=2547395 RepID=A0A4R5KXP6_9BACL|nr:HAD family phosphatase [Paenibacillus piri]TDF99790.1 HAD family phosphatase [Paenibacillus piri]